ncbi:MAG: hypothetical protein Q4F85_05590 [Prevotella sp.]|nr:hypothetical protein [Prevotella sp.]
MVKTKVLVAVKTYPTLSQKYDELVCTAGFLEDGSWIRVYPMPFRKLNNRYKKWQWIELELVKNDSDPRKESYRPYNYDDIILGEVVGTKNGWAERKEIALTKVYTSMDELIQEAQNPNIGTSLAVFKPMEIIDFIWEPCERDWDERKVKAIYGRAAQASLFDTAEELEVRKHFKIVDKVPYEFSYIFKSKDGKKRKLMIEDWEVGALYRRYVKDYHLAEIEACKKVKEKYLYEFAYKKDLYFFLGTTKRYHFFAKNPFIIIGTFAPPFPTPQEPSLFDFCFDNE